MLQEKMLESKTNEVKIEDIDAEVMQEVIRFIYTGTADWKIASQLLDVAFMYEMEKLQDKCTDALCWNLSPENAIETLVLGDKLGNEYLQEICIKYIGL